MVVGGALLVALTAFTCLASAFARFPGEVAVSLWVQSWRTPWLDTAMKAVSAMGVEAVAMVLVALVTLALFLIGLRREGGLVVAATIVGYLLRSILKMAVARPRPPTDLLQVVQQADGYSFPSGHVMHYVVLLGTLAFILSSISDSREGRWMIHVFMVVALIIMGLSRIYLGVHWLGDVVGGYAFGAVVVVGAVWTWRRWVNRREQPIPPDRPS